MTHADFVKLVRNMRAAQNRYFHARMPEDLLVAKDYERRVDKALSDDADQIRLFPDSSRNTGE